MPSGSQFCLKCGQKTDGAAIKALPAATPSIVMCQLRYELASDRRVLPEMRTARAVNREPRSPGDGAGRVHDVFGGSAGNAEF
jgi:hypothetical protein